MSADTRQLPLDIRWQDAATLEDFLPVGNELALAALDELLAQPPGPWLYLYGGSGSGKTHLLQAACGRLVQGGAPVAYLSAARPEFLPRALAGLEGMGLVAVDDLQHLAGKPPAQEALFHLYNGLQDRGGRLLAAATGRPADLHLALADLRSRLSWCQVHRLAPLRDAALATALQQRARRRGLELPDETASYLMTRLPRDVSGLFGVLEQLDHAALAAQRRLTIPFVRQCLWRE